MLIDLLLFVNSDNYLAVSVLPGGRLFVAFIC